MSTSRGFTLIELLLVISIIALLSGIMMTTFAQGRGKAKDAAVKRQVTEMRTLLAREFSDVGSYQNLKAGGAAKSPGSTCAVGSGSTQLKGTYATDFKAQCDALLRIYGSTCNHNGAAGGTCLRFNQPPNSGTPTEAEMEKFSIWAFLPETSRQAGVNTYLCMGSNGRTSLSTLVGAQTQNSGCYADPGL